MKRDFQYELRNFDSVWQRVTAAKAKSAPIKLMPRKGKCSPCRRRCR